MNDKKQTTRTVDLVSLSSLESCSGPELPVPLKEAQIFEFDDTILLCTSFTEKNKNTLQCFNYMPKMSEMSKGDWMTYSAPVGNREIISFTYSKCAIGACC